MISNALDQNARQRDHKSGEIVNVKVKHLTQRVHVGHVSIVQPCHLKYVVHGHAPKEDDNGGQQYERHESEHVVDECGAKLQSKV